MHFVFIVGSYYPYYSAVGKCAGNVADMLSKNHNVTIICEKSYCEQKDEDEYNNQKILRIITKETVNREKLKENIKKAQGFIKYFHILRFKIFKALQASKLVLSNISIKRDLVDLYVSKLVDIDEKIDVIIPVSMPFESVMAASQYKKQYSPEVLLLPYLFDKFTNSQTLHRLEINKLIKKKVHIQLEKQVLSSANNILTMHSLKNFYESEIPKLKTFLYIEHPLIIPRDVDYNLPKEGSIRIAYIGGFYKKYVEPNYLLELFSQTCINARLEFYVIGNCNKIIDKYKKKESFRIINQGSVEKEIANKKVSENDILISVAEKSGHQMSSKIFDYISYGKPIVHFYTNDEDVNLKILKKYPLALCLKEDSEFLNRNIKAFEKFCLENSGKIVSKDKVIDLFPDALPVYTAGLIERLVRIN